MGFYRSADGGYVVARYGLENSPSISQKSSSILPTQDHHSGGGAWPLCGAQGGERGLYKSTDGGKNWVNKLSINEWTGVTDLVIDPTNPDILYLASWQRHRNVAAHMGGGPGTSLYKSVDGGETWVKIDNGLPSSNMGKIGLAISPMNPKKYFMQQSSWIVVKELFIDHQTVVGAGQNVRHSLWWYRSSLLSRACCLSSFDRIYLMNVRALVSEDGGKTFYTMSEANKHSDNHSLTFKKNDPNYLLFGTDGGIYESFDDSKS